MSRLSKLIITFLPRSKCLLISWLQSPSAVILEHPKIKSDTFSTVSPSISHEVMGPDAMILVFWLGILFSHKKGWSTETWMCLQCGRPGFDPWVGKIPWRRQWLPTPVFLPGEFQGLRSLVGYSPWGHKELDMTEQLIVTHVKTWMNFENITLSIRS